MTANMYAMEIYFTMNVTVFIWLDFEMFDPSKNKNCIFFF